MTDTSAAVEEGQDPSLAQASPPAAASPSPATPVHPAGARSIDLLHNVEMQVTVELGQAKLLVKDLLALRVGSIVDLDRSAGSPVDVLVNGALLAHGEVVVIDDEFGVRITEILNDDAIDVAR